MKINRLACVFMICATPLTAFGSVSAGVFVSTPPPALPIYVQPPCPAPGYLWTPGYWAYDSDDLDGMDGYYWVPGVWVRPPRVGVLWTPGYWRYRDDNYYWNSGYWAPRVGFYGGVHYGYGYDGVGFVGGRWERRHYYYNTTVVNVNRAVIHNTYIDHDTIDDGKTVNHTSFNGGSGIRAQPTARDRTVMQNNHVKHTSEQAAHVQAARRSRQEHVSYHPDAPQITTMGSVNGRRYNSQGHIARDATSSRSTPSENSNRNTRSGHQPIRHRPEHARGNTGIPPKREYRNRQRDH